MELMINETNEILIEIQHKFVCELVRISVTSQRQRLFFKNSNTKIHH